MTEIAHALITGGAGFIGSHLTDHLLAQGATVTVIDDLSTGTHQNLSEAHQLHPNHITFIEATLQSTLPTLKPQTPFTHIFHLAAAVGVQKIVDEPIAAIEANIEPTAQLLRFAAQQQTPPTTLIASSSEVYGKSQQLPFKESGDCLYGPTTSMRWSYAASKAIDEYLALAYHTQHNLPTIVVRLFNTVGPRQLGSYGMVLPRFVHAALNSNPLQVFGDGTQTRCFCDVRDVAPALASLANNHQTKGQIFNLGSDHEISIKDLANLVIQTTHSRSTIKTIPYHDAFGPGFEDPPARLPDLTNIKQAINFNPNITLQQTITDIATHLSKDTQNTAPIK